MFQRALKQKIVDRLFQHKAIVVIGARQVGKSTLINEIVTEANVKNLTLNCDEPDVRQLLHPDINATQLRLLIGDNKLIAIDEAQRIDNVGLLLKRIIDSFPDVQLLVTGSSSFQLKNQLNEPLTGRKFEYEMFPISTQEIYLTDGLLSVGQLLETRLIYGSYPDVLNNIASARETLINLADSYLYKDILAMDGIRKPDVLQKILVALALQLGSEVSINELAQTVGIDSKTAERYIDLLEKCFVIYRLSALSRNLRNELKKTRKIYFYDNGVRNAIIRNFAPSSLRSDMGALWENFFITERMKLNNYDATWAQPYFWRTSSQQEIDYIEELDGQFSLYEMKWNPNKRNTRFPASFMKAYPVKSAEIVTPENYLPLLIQG